MVAILINSRRLEIIKPQKNTTPNAFSTYPVMFRQQLLSQCNRLDRVNPFLWDINNNIFLKLLSRGNHKSHCGHLNKKKNNHLGMSATEYISSPIHQPFWSKEQTKNRPELIMTLTNVSQPQSHKKNVLQLRLKRLAQQIKRTDSKINHFIN